MENLNEKKWYDAHKASSNSKIIDVRTPDEFDNGYIEGARLLNIQDSSKFMAEVEKLEKDTDFYVYCRSGKRSEMACQLMERAGIESTFNLQGGILDWTGDLKK